jgi:5'-nucleotidase
VGQAPAVASHLVISQFSLEGSGGESDEFVEIYNPTGATVSLGGHSLQYKHQGSGGAGYQVFTFPSSSVPSHGWFLVVGSGYTGAVTADAVNSGFQADSTAGGTWYLVGDLTTLSGQCASSPSIIDKVAWGTAGSGVCPEGNPTTAPTGTASQQRRPGGACGDGQDTDNNAADFVTLTTSSPHNRFSPPQP